MNILTSDFETTILNKGNVYDARNKAVCLGEKVNNNVATCMFNTHMLATAETKFDLYVFFNAKFDVGWYRRLGVDISNWKIWDCQIAEFLLEGQTNPYPSLNQAAEKYGFPVKLDVVKTEYWDKGVDTDKVPEDVLSDYCCYDVELTYKVYLKQLEQFQEKPALFKLFKLMCQDMLILQEMEWNGIVYDEQLCKERSLTIDKQLQEIKDNLNLIYPSMAINFNSGDQLSAFLYGGTIVEDGKEHVGFYKTGAKAGLPKYKNIQIEHQLPRLITPLAKSELQKEGYFKTDAATLQKLKGPAAKKFVGPLLEMAKLEKLNGTYYKGIPQLVQEMNWTDGVIHGSYNQCRAATGRLSSSQPNQQNFSGEMLDVFVSRYGEN